jgi:general secretion pathway protein G
MFGALRDTSDAMKKSNRWPAVFGKPGTVLFVHADLSTSSPVALVPRHGFTRIEVAVLSVVVMILAATALPRFAPPETSAKDAALQFNMNLLRSQLETYKNQHNGVPPRLSLFKSQMTMPTSRTGHVIGKDLTCGPYFEGQIPLNPYNDSNIVTMVAKPGQSPKFNVPGRAGWQYDESIGAIYPNNPEYYAHPR